MPFPINAKNHNQYKEKSLARKPWALAREVANLVARKATPPVTEVAWGPSSTTPTQSRVTAERGSAGWSIPPRREERPLGRAGLMYFADLLRHILVLLVSKEMNHHTRHVRGADKRAALLKNGLVLLSLRMPRLPRTIRQLLKTCQKRKWINKIPWSVRQSLNRLKGLIHSRSLKHLLKFSNLLQYFIDSLREEPF